MWLTIRIRHVVAGHFGGVHDSRMFRTSALSTHEYSFFSSFQWLAGDSAFPLLKALITPFRSNLQIFQQSIKLSTYAIADIVWGMILMSINWLGLSKERFGSHKELRTSIQDEKVHPMFQLIYCLLYDGKPNELSPHGSGQLVWSRSNDQTFVYNNARWPIKCEITCISTITTICVRFFNLPEHF